jgi:hypothetical protein
MSLLIGLILALATLTAILAATTQYSPVGAMLQTQARIAAKGGMAQIEAGMKRYVRDHLDAAGNPVIPPVGTDLQPLLTPTYMFLPAPPRGTQWVLRSSSAFGLSAFYACIAPVDSAQAQGDTQRALELLKPSFPGRYFLGNACGVSTEQSGNGSYATYWFIPAHAL